MYGGAANKNSNEEGTQNQATLASDLFFTVYASDMKRVNIAVKWLNCREGELKLAIVLLELLLIE